MRFVCSITLSIIVISLTLCQLVHAAPPNIVLIVTDDQGYGDFGATGNGIIETPHIDAMATRCASMATFYVSPVCSPTRASLMTGRYNYRTRCIDTFVGRSMMDPGEVTIAEVLRPAGFRTGIFGKWHLGDCYPMRPMDQGFDVSLVHRGGGLAQPADPPENERRYTNPVLYKNGEKIQTTGYCTDVYFDGALDFIEEAASTNQPFFAYIATNAPHGPFHDVPEELYARYKEKDLDSLMVNPPSGQRLTRERDNLARIGAMITNIDDNVGKLLQSLDSLGIVDNTLVVFMVDNGPNTARYVGPFRGRKTEVFEGGIRSPLWLQWPEGLEPGTSRHEPVAHIDIMPTLLEAAGASAPEGVHLDGRSFLPLLENENAPWPERTLVLQTHRGDRPVRYHNFMTRDSRWKLLHPSGFGRESFEGQPRFELYDLQNDPGERNDLATDRPEIVARLRTAYDEWFDDVSTTRPANYAPPRIVIGNEKAPVTDLTRQDWRQGTWDRDSNGHWLVEVAASGLYDIAVRIYPRAEDGKVTLRAGSLALTRSLSAEDTVCTFREVLLRAGNQRIMASIQYGESEVGPFQIHVTKTIGSI